MRISRVYVEAELVEGEHLAFDPDRNHYLKHVLRLQPGAAVDLFNGRDGKDYRATLIRDGKRLGAAIETAAPRETESPLDSTLVQALGRADHLDWLLQKATELGVRRLVIFNAERTQHPLRPGQLDKKMRHWHGIAISACEQCGRACLPRIDFQADLAQALDCADAALKLLLRFGGEPLTAQLRATPASLSLLTGPEGGFSPVEFETATARGYREASLGPRVLRFETAAVTALALVQSRAGDLG